MYWCEDDEVTLYVPAVDVSDDGMCGRTGCPFAKGHELRIGFSGPEGEGVATARVVWSSPSRGTPATGLSLEGFESGREVFEKMVERARGNARRLRSAEVMSEAPREYSRRVPGLPGDSTP